MLAIHPSVIVRHVGTARQSAGLCQSQVHARMPPLKVSGGGWDSAPTVVTGGSLQAAGVLGTTCVSCHFAEPSIPGIRVCRWFGATGMTRDSSLLLELGSHTQR